MHQKQNGQEILGGLNITVDRNHFGSQLASFQGRLKTVLGPDFEDAGVFIRAPGILEVEKGVEVLAEAQVKGEFYPCAVKQGNIIATSFHPELSDSYAWHTYFVQLANENRKKAL